MALVIGLIMLVMMTLVAVVSYNLATTSLEVVGNTQSRNQAVISANSAIEEAMSTVRMFETPTTIFLNPCGNVNNTRCYDINEDGDTDISVTLAPAPTCRRWQNIATARLVLSDDNDLACMRTDSPDCTGIAGCASGESLCANSVWEVTAVAVDAVTNANVSVVVGTEVRVKQDDIATTCIAATPTPTPSP